MAAASLERNCVGAGTPWGIWFTSSFEGHIVVPFRAPITALFMKSAGPPGDGELLKIAEGEASWLAVKFDIGETSREPDVFRPFIDCVNEYC
jgi:hypothetical protein